MAQTDSIEYKLMRAGGERKWRYIELPVLVHTAMSYPVKLISYDEKDLLYQQYILLSVPHRQGGHQRLQYQCTP